MLHPSRFRLLFGLLGLLATVLSASAFAAKKKPNNKKGGGASNKKGFGAAPPTLAGVAKTFKTRLPENNPNDLECPCCTVPGATYGNCCAPYHRQEKESETPLRVLQSRYSAFCFRVIPHIIHTTHPTCRDYRKNQVAWAQDLNKNGMFDSFDFVKLEAGPVIFPDDTNNPNAATIDFTVRLRAKDGEELETSVSEKSLFLRDPNTKEWTYASGEVRSGVEGLEDAILNQ